MVGVVAAAGSTFAASTYLHAARKQTMHVSGNAHHAREGGSDQIKREVLDDDDDGRSTTTTTTDARNMHCGTGRCNNADDAPVVEVLGGGNVEVSAVLAGRQGRVPTGQARDLVRIRLGRVHVGSRDGAGSDRCLQEKELHGFCDVV